MPRHRHGLSGDERGAAVIELALVAPLFALLVIGIVDLSNAYGRKLALEQGAQRAIEKIMQTTEADTVENTLKTEAVCQVNGTNTDGTCRTSPITASNVTVNYRLQCMSGTSVSSDTTNTDPTAFDALTCSTGQTENRYIEVQVSDRYQPLFPIHFARVNGDGTYHMTATAGMRTQ